MAGISNVAFSTILALASEVWIAASDPTFSADARCLQAWSVAEICKRTVNTAAPIVLGSGGQLTRHRTGIPLRIAATPIPGMTDDRLQIGEARIPSQVLPNALARCDQNRRITGAAGANLDRDIASGNARRRLDDLSNRVATAISQVIAAAFMLKLREHPDMSVRQIGNMDVIADAGAVVSRVILSKDLDIRALSRRDIENQRDQMRFRIVILAQMAVGMRTGCVEIAQAGGTHPMDLVRPVKNPLDHELGLAVRAA